MQEDTPTELSMIKMRKLMPTVTSKTQLVQLGDRMYKKEGDVWYLLSNKPAKREGGR